MKVFEVSLMEEFIKKVGDSAFSIGAKTSGNGKLTYSSDKTSVATVSRSGKVTIKISDTYCPWNNDCFTLEFGDNIVITRGGKPDIEMDIKSFTSAILGRFDFDSCRIFPDVKVYGNEENLKKIFFKKTCFIEEHF